jgi:hypothetical protein
MRKCPECGAAFHKLGPHLEAAHEMWDGISFAGTHLSELAPPGTFIAVRQLGYNYCYFARPRAQVVQDIMGIWQNILASPSVEMSPAAQAGIRQWLGRILPDAETIQVYLLIRNSPKERDVLGTFEQLADFFDLPRFWIK